MFSQMNPKRKALRLLTWICFSLCCVTISMQTEDSSGYCDGSGSCQETQEIRLVLLGITGVGKSTLANAIVQNRKYKAGGLSQSTTKSCQTETTHRNGKTLRVVDSPSFFYTDMTLGELQEQIIPILHETSPGPHAIIYVQEAGKFAEEQEKGFQLLIKMFGKEILNFTTIAFTKLGYGVTEEEYLGSQHEVLKSITGLCGNRVVFLPTPDKDFESKEKVDKLLNIIENMILKNNWRHYTSGMYEAQQTILEEEMERKRQKAIQEEEMRLRAKTAKIEAKCEEELKQIRGDQEMQKKLIEALEAERKSRDENIRRLNEKIKLQDQKIADESSGFWGFLKKIWKKIFG